MSKSYNAAILETAGQYLGEKEWPGAKHNPIVTGFFSAVGHGWVKDDETAWCAAFVGSVLAQLGLSHSGKLNARSYLNWGRKVSIAQAQPGDVVVLWRGDPNGWQGHVGFLVGWNGGKVTLRGGNQGNQVSDQDYPTSRVLGIRRAEPSSEPSMRRPTLSVGDNGSFVMDMQDQLRTLGYHSGNLDGKFGKNTRASVVSFQADNDLDPDGIVGHQTWAALKSATPKSVRDVSESTLRERGSRTIAAADVAEEAGSDVKGGNLMMAGVSSLGIGAAGWDGLIENLEHAQTFSEKAQAFLGEYWWIFLIVVIAIVVIHRAGLIGDAAMAIRQFRTEDAQTGANMKR